MTMQTPTGLLEHRMTVRFETVKYNQDLLMEMDPAGFGQLHYDKAKSPKFQKVEEQQVYLDPGGLVDAVGSIGADPQWKYCRCSCYRFTRC